MIQTKQKQFRNKDNASQPCLLHGLYVNTNAFNRSGIQIAFGGSPRHYFFVVSAPFFSFIPLSLSDERVALAWRLRSTTAKKGGS